MDGAPHARVAHIYTMRVKFAEGAYKSTHKNSGGQVEAESGSAESLAEQVARLIEGGETFEVEFKGRHGYAKALTATLRR